MKTAPLDLAASAVEKPGSSCASVLRDVVELCVRPLRNSPEIIFVFERSGRARAQPFEGVRVSDLEAFREIAESASMDGENP